MMARLYNRAVTARNANYFYIINNLITSIDNNNYYLYHVHLGHELDISLVDERLQ